MNHTMQDILLEPRAREILKHIISSYILTGEPIGSRTIAKISREGLSSASVRNVMADLEEHGYLSQPHASAGRVPTDKGYRYYVDALLPDVVVGSRERAFIDQNLGRAGGELSDAMEAIPRLLSHLTSQVGYLISPPISDVRLKHIEFLRLHERRVLVIFVDRTEMVSHRVLDSKGEVTTGELQAVREAGFGDEEIVEIIAHVAVNTWTNFLGKVGRIDIDFPEVALLGQSHSAEQAACAC